MNESIDVPRLMQYFLEQNGYWNEEYRMYEFGTKTIGSNETELEKEAFILTKFHSLNWMDNLIIKVPSQKETIKQLTFTTQKAFFSTYLPVEEDIRKIKQLSGELIKLEWL